MTIGILPKTGDIVNLSQLGSPADGVKRPLHSYAAPKGIRKCGDTMFIFLCGHHEERPVTSKFINVLDIPFINNRPSRDNPVIQQPLHDGFVNPFPHCA